MKKILALAFAAALLVAFTAPAMAKTYIGGIVFQQVYYYENEVNESTEALYPQEDDFSTVYWDLMGVSRFRVRLTNEDNVGLYFEVGADYEALGNNSIWLRHLYGWWDINPNFRLIAGQTSIPFSVLAPDTILGLDFAGKIVGIGYGEYDASRAPQVRFQWKLGDMGFVRLALLDPNTTASPFTVESGASSSDFDNTLPRIDLGVPLYFGAVKVYPSIFYQKQNYDNVASGSDDSFTAWGAALGVKFGFGPLMVAAEVTTGDNWAWSVTGADGAVTPAVVNGDVEDAEATAWWIDVSFKLGKITPHLIYGQLTSERDPSGTANDWETDRKMYGITARVPLAKGFMIRPEIMFYDREDEVAGVDNDYGKDTVIGLTFQIAF